MPGVSGVSLVCKSQVCIRSDSITFVYGEGEMRGGYSFGNVCALFLVWSKYLSLKKGAILDQLKN
jgi:hypothetical protein